MTHLRSAKHLVILIALVLCGCDLSGKKTPPADSATTGASFQVKSVEGSMDPDRVDPVFLTPVSRLFNFRACIIDNLYQKQVSNQRFTIWNGDELVADRVSEENGCLTWQERPQFNFFAASEYIFQTRTIRGEGASRGSVRIPLAVNPWLHGESIPPVVDLTRNQVNSYNAVTTNFSSSYKSFLWLERVDLLNIREWSATGGQLTLASTLQIPTQFLAKDSFGREAIVPIPGGIYNVDITLYVESDQAREIQVLDRIHLERVSSLKGLITADIHISPRVIPQSGIYKIGLKLTPVNGPETLGAFEGTFNLKSVDAFVWSGDAGATLAPEVFGKAGSYSLRFLDTFEPVVPGPSQTTAYFIDRNVTCMFDRVEVETETAATRAVRYRAQYCIRRRDNQRPRAGIMIHVKRNFGDEIDLPTNENGCIDLEDKLTHNFYEPECRHLATIRATNAELGLDEEASLQLNPWHGYGTFCRDARIVSREEMATMEDRETCMANRPRSEVFIDAFDLNEQSVSYEVDNNLNLKVLKTMRFGLYMKVTRPSNQIDSRALTDLLRQGLYLLRWVVIRNGYEDPNKAYNYVTGGEAIVRSTGGRIIHDAVLKVTDPRIIDSRNRILFEISFIDEHKVEWVGDSYRPKDGFALKDLVIDAGVSPVIYDGNLEVRGNGFVVLRPFNLAKLDGTADSQLEQFKPWLERGLMSTDAKFFPYHFKDLGEIVAMGSELERLETLRQDDIKNSYNQLQDLTRVTPENPLGEDLSYQALLDVMYAKATNWDTHRELCRYWAHHLMPGVFREYGYDNLTNAAIWDFYIKCATNRDSGLGSVDFLRWIGFRNSPALIYQNILRVEEVSYDHMLPPGRNYQITIGDQFSMGSRFVNTTDATFKLPIGKLPILGPIIEMGFGLANTSTFRLDHGSDLTFGAHANLNAEENTMVLNVKKYRRCMIVRMSPTIKRQMSYLGVSLRAIDDEVARAQAERTIFSRGIEVCGPVQMTPIQVHEKYYYVQTTRSVGSQQDPTDIRNRWHSVAIRSVRDMTAFLQMGKSRIDSPDVMDETFDGLGTWTANMDEVFGTISPAAPGVYVEAIYF